MGQYTSYWLYQKYETRDNQTIPVYPNYWSIDADGTLEKVIKIDNDPACGYDPRPVTYRWVNLDPTKDYYCDDCPEPQYRWVDMNPSTDYYCEGTTKYYKQKKQVSYDGGQTWEDVVPAEYQRGNVYETESTDCGYVPPTPTTIYRWTQTEATICVEDSPTPPTPTGYTEQYFTVVPKGNGYLALLDSTEYGVMFSFSTDEGVTWETEWFAELETNKPLWIRKNTIINATSTSASTGTFSASTGVQFEVEGNIMSLAYGSDFIGKDSFRYSGRNYTNVFKNLFKNCTGLTSIQNLVLPATALTDSCYYGMFRGCTSLTTVPSNLLPVTTLASECYAYMFQGCTSLAGSPVLPAQTMEYLCYGYMFSGCTSLNNVTCLATDISASFCTGGWLRNVSSTGTFYKNSSMSSWPTGTDGIPTNWTVLDYTP